MWWQWITPMGMLIEGVGAAIITLDVLPEFNHWQAGRKIGSASRQFERLIRSGQDALRTASDPQEGYSIAPIEDYRADIAAGYLRAAPVIDVEGLQRSLVAIERAAAPFRWPGRPPSDLEGIYKRFTDLVWDDRHYDLEPEGQRPPVLFGAALLVLGFLCQVGAAVPWAALGP